MDASLVQRAPFKYLVLELLDNAILHRVPSIFLFNIKIPSGKHLKIFLSLFSFFSSQMALEHKPPLPSFSGHTASLPGADRIKLKFNQSEQLK